MLFITHLLFGIFIGYPLLHLGLLELLSFLLGSVIPDIDSSASKVGRKFGFVSMLIEIIFGHRGIVHSVWIPILLFIAYLMTALSFLKFFAFGYILHLGLDAVTKTGIRVFGPFGLRVKGLIKTGGIIEIALVLAGLIAFMLIYTRGQ
ncbi:metal-dependent hydrolase [archaeon]|nr:metal-dependent hydrolase [archaeon]